MRNARGHGLMLLCLLAVAGGAKERALSQDAATALGGTSWRLVRFQGSDDTTLTPGEKAGYTIAFEAEGRVSIRVDCNRGSGTWKSAGPNQLEFGPLAVTSAMCSPAPLNNRLPRDFQYVRSYILKDGHLLLSLMADGGVYEFEPMHAEDETAGIVKGTATFRERMALPPDAILKATLEDVSRADAPAERIAQAHVGHPGNPPIAFEIKYDPARIAPNHRYAVRARILVGEQLLFTTDQQYPVLTGGHGHDVTLLLRRASATPRAGGAASPTQPLEGTDWKLTQLGDTAVVAAAEPRAPYFVLDSATHRVAGSGGCNRLMGSYEVHDDRLSFGQMAGTMMACSAGMETEQAFLKVFPHVTSWKITGQHLELLDAADKVLARFQARAAK